LWERDEGGNEDVEDEANITTDDGAKDTGDGGTHDDSKGESEGTEMKDGDRHGGVGQDRDEEHDEKDDDGGRQGNDRGAGYARMGSRSWSRSHGQWQKERSSMSEEVSGSM
jgi:hypothetical protein